MYNYDDEKTYDSDETFDELTKLAIGVINDFNTNNKISRKIRGVVRKFSNGCRALSIVDDVYPEVLLTDVCVETINKYTSKPTLPINTLTSNKLSEMVTAGSISNIYIFGLREKDKTISTW